MTPRTLGRLHGSRTAGTASFEVLISSPSLGLAAQAVGCRSLLSSTPSGTGTKVQALAVRSSATAFSAQGMCYKSRTSKSFSSLHAWSRLAANCRSLQEQSPLTCLIMSWESPFTSSRWTPSDTVVLNPKSSTSYSAMLLVGLKSRSPCGARNTTPRRPPAYVRSHRRKEFSGV
jgi:hypothetical protein